MALIPSLPKLDASRLSRPRVSDEIVERLERAIMEGGYGVGQALPSERELMATFQVGRPAVREALYTLAQRGVVSVRSGARARVTEPNPVGAFSTMSLLVRHLLGRPGGIGHFQEVRALLEVALARMAASECKEEELGTLQRALQANKDAIGNRREFNRTDVDFHFQLARRTDNPLILAVHAAMAEWLAEQRDVALAAGSMSRTFHDHARIYQAIADRDPDRAAAAMQSHLNSVARNYRKSLRAAANSPPDGF